MMKKSTIKVDQKRRRGRPATGRDPMVSSRIPAETIAEIDQWAEGNGTTRSDAIRQLVEIALASGGKRPSRYAKKTAAKARELASKTIDNLIDPSVSDNEKAIRKRRLLKGPSVFRDVRADAKR